MIVEIADRIEKQVQLNAPRARVWQALTDARQLGSWFGLAFDGDVQFTPGARVQAQVTHEGYEHLTWDVIVETVEPEHIFSWRWHPYAVESDQDYLSEPTTLVVFELTGADGGTLLTVTESGFNDAPPERLAEAYRRNEQGWEAQMEAIARYVHETA